MDDGDAGIPGNFSDLKTGDHIHFAPHFDRKFLFDQQTVGFSEGSIGPGYQVVLPSPFSQSFDQQAGLPLAPAQIAGTVDM